ncbi:alpha/beta fold hydrolase [Candidatus Woesearchaeota archaeon]|nr:alpha/beta fold hydrolase [Candidatus Woesearchaeota archaeon]
MDLKKALNYGIIMLIFLASALNIGCQEASNQNNSVGINGTNDTNVKTEGGDIMSQAIKLHTEDGFELQAKYYPSAGGPAVICLHQLNLNKETFDDLAKDLNKEGFAILSIDLRGHGNSLMQNGDKRDWQHFTNTDFQNMEFDVLAGVEWLKTQDTQKGNITVIGASIGANTAYNFVSKHEETASAVLLSPGLLYKGIDTEKTIWPGNKSLLTVVSSGDSYAYHSARELNQKTGKELFVLEGNKHGTYMLDKSVRQKIIDFLTS